VDGVTLGRFKRWFWRPPRPHGELIVGRRVSPLELLYDLVYAAVISRAGSRFAEHMTPGGLIEFAVVFSLIWIAWVNGTLYLELHGRDDGRTRTFVFVQMGLLAVLAVFAANAAADSGPAFALTYGAFLAVMAWLWYTVRVEDRRARPEMLAQTGRYIAGMAASTAAMLASALLADGSRLVVWACFAGAWIGYLLLWGRSPVGLGRGSTPATESLVERFGLFTIIVLGEVVFDVVAGLSAATHDAATIATGMIALVLGFGFWWIYFDVVGGRLPRRDGQAVATWMVSHHPITLAIASTGAATVGLVERAHDAAAPATMAWVLAGAVGLGLLAVLVAAQTLADAARLPTVYRPLTFAIPAGAAAAAAVGWARPAPSLLALLLVCILSALWVFAVGRFLRAGAWFDAAHNQSAANPPPDRELDIV
jgi:low temperature requirement protein LtrA